MDSVFTGESYLFRGRWSVIGPCVGVKQTGTALCNPGSINPSAPIHLSRILERTSRYPYMIKKKATTETLRSESEAKRKVFHKFRRVSAAAHSIAVTLSSCNKTASSSAIPPLASSLLADLRQKVPRVLRRTTPDHLAVRLRTRG